MTTPNTPKTIKELARDHGWSLATMYTIVQQRLVPTTTTGTSPLFKIAVDEDAMAKAIAEHGERIEAAFNIPKITLTGGSVAALTAIEDPIERARAAAAEIERLRAELGKAADVRAEAIEAMLAQGMTMEIAGSLLGITRARINDIVKARRTK